MEEIMDMDAYILDYLHEKIIYLTKNSSFRWIIENHPEESFGYDLLNKDDTGRRFEKSTKNKPDWI
ncbi:MAG: hypothetical protein LIP01_05895 [Tannerellaceae bacterium]|nr:hypothetical protein [Tannerellaceae bacterium]